MATDPRVNFSDPFSLDQDTTTGSPSGQGRLYALLQRVELWGFKAVAALFRAMPLDLASDLSGWIWRTVAPRLRRHARTLDNLAVAFPDMAADEREQIARRMWDFLGRTFAEAFHLDEIMDDASRIEVNMTPEAHAQLTTGTGLVVVSLHMGNWEAVAIGAARMGLDIAGVFQRMKNPLVDAEVMRMRQRLYPLGLFPKGHDAVRRLMRVISAGKAVAVLADTREGRGVMVPFFGRLAPTNPFPAVLARGRNVPIMAGYLIRTGTARFRLEVEMIPVSRGGSQQQDVLETTAAIHACFERWIRAHPDQWMWSHRRWG
jgi:KDO2-lipid IV(A) lauroyltransferase